MNAITLSEVRAKVQRLCAVNDHRGAVDLLEEILRDDKSTSPDRSWAHHVLGRFQYYDGNTGEARRHFREALRIDPADYYSRFYLARIADQQGDDIAALQAYARCLPERPQFSPVVDFMTSIIGRMSGGTSECGELHSTAAAPPDPNAPALPRVSVLMLCHNKAEFTERALEALLLNTTYANLEILAVDNGSADHTAGLLETYAKRIKVVRPGSNLGFVDGNNAAALEATGDYLVFLNNDTEVQKHWLEELLRCFSLHPRAGAVGSMLVDAGGRLQEAGAVLFNDASGWNYGRGGAPGSPLYSFVREVDYCSGAALMVRADLFAALGGFDTRFAPAYYEDSDLCMGVRELGFKVLYCPTSVVVHHEGTTSGTDLTTGFKRYQEINRPKFFDKWQQRLARHHPHDPGRIYQFSHRHRGKTILILDDWPPLPDKSAGTLRMHNIVTQMLALGYRVTYVHLVGKNMGDTASQHLKELRVLGVELIWFEYESWWEQRDTPSVRPVLERLIAGLDLAKRRPDLVFISFWHVANYFIDFIRTAIPSTPIVVDSVDLHYVREERQAELLNDDQLRRAAGRTKKREIETYAKADGVLTVTEEDRAHLRKELPDKAVLIMPTVHDPVETTAGFTERTDFLFIGNFNHAPNEDAVLYFVNDIFPFIKREIPDAKFLVVGNNPTPRITALRSDDVIVTGWVPSLTPYLDQSRVSVVPLRFGAGIKGKVGEALAHGLPTVMTSIAAEGMNILQGEHAFVADDPESFARCAIRLYRESEPWEKFSRNGKELVASQYSSAATRKRLAYLMTFERREDFTSSRALRSPAPPRVSIVLVTYNQRACTLECLESIRKYTHVSHEVIVVDNASTDGTVKHLDGLADVRLLKNDANRGFPAGANQGIVAAVGEHVVLLNNDTVVTEGWLERLLEVAGSDPSIGLVGPVSNRVSGIQQDPLAHYTSIQEMHRYAEAVRKEYAGAVIAHPRVAFLCTLITRDAIERLGGLDERFSPGNFEDDDFCLRAQLAGFTTVIARDVFIHHHGSKSFGAEGEAAYARRLETNRKIFVEKWGADPMEIWKDRKEFRKRNVRYPLGRDAFGEHFDRARILIEEKELTRALASLKTALEHFHTSERDQYAVLYTDVLNLTGNIAVAVRDFATAETCYQTELALSPKSSRAHEGLAMVRRVRSDNREVADALDRANASRRDGDQSGAAKILRDALRSHPGDARLSSALAWIFVETRLFEDASKLISETPDSVKKSVEWLEIAGFCSEGQGFDDVAGQCADKALELVPASHRAATLKGILAAKGGDEQEALRLFGQSIAHNNGYALAHMHLGALLWRIDRKEEGFLHLEKAFTLDPVSADSALAFYSAAEALGKLPVAESRFAAASAASPRHKQLKALVADVLVRQRKLPEAMAVLEESLLQFGPAGNVLPFALEIRKSLGPKASRAPNGRHKTISLCMIVKDEEQHLARALSSVAALVDEMIVVDTGSTDRTKDIAVAFGAKVHAFIWNDSFADARNVSLSRATGDWILVLDADEVIAPSDHESLRKLVDSPNGSPRAFSFTTKNYVRGTDTQGWQRNDGIAPEEAGTGWIPSEKVRLFPRRASIRFEHPVHELVEPSLAAAHVRVVAARIPVHHYGKLDVTGSREKGERYLALGKTKLAEAGPSDLKALEELSIQENELGNFERALELCQRLVTLDPDNPRAHMGVGSNCIGLRRFRESLRPFERTLELAPDLNEAYIRYSIALLVLERAGEAARVMQRLVDRDPAYPYSKAMLAAALFCAGEPINAQKLLKELSEQAVACDVFFSDLARRLKSEGRTAYAIALLEPLHESGVLGKESAFLLVECYRMQTVVT